MLNDSATTMTYTYGHTLSLHDALPISGRGPMARRGPHGALLGRDAESIGDPRSRPLVIRRENDADVAVIEDRIMLAVGFIDLIETLGDQIDPDPVARDRKSVV